MKFKHRLEAILLLFFLCASVWTLSGRTAYASEGTGGLENQVNEAEEERFSQGSPWMEQADGSIYSHRVDTEENGQDIEPGNPGMVERYLSELVRNVASSLVSLLEESLDASIDHVIYGRVGSGKPNSVNIYGFELRSGNPYGVTASVCYSLVRGMVFVFLGIWFTFTLAKGAWSGQTARTRGQVRDEFCQTGKKFVLLALMPYIFDILLYTRDVALYGIKEVTGVMMSGGATLSLSKSFLVNAERTGRFVDSLMYLGTVALTVYFAFIYIAVALDLLICFIAFPVLCLLHSGRRDLLDGWGMSVLSDILTPVLDAVLLLVPLLTSLMLSDVIRGIAFIQLFMCMLIIPSRNRIKTLLGIQRNEQAGLFGMVAAITLGRSVVNAVKGSARKLSGIRSDLQKSKMHGEMASVDEEEQQSLLSGFGDWQGQAHSVGETDSADTGAWEAAGGDRPRDLTGIPEPTGNTGEKTDVGPEDRPGHTDEWTDAKEAGDVGHTEGGSMPEGPLGDGFAGAVKIPGLKEEIDTGTPAGLLHGLDQELNRKQEALDSLRGEKARFQKLEKQAARRMLDCEKGSEEYRDWEKRRADASLHVAEAEQRISGQTQEVNRLKGQMKTLQGSRTGPVPGSFDEKRARILAQYADINNFEQQEFKGSLNNAQLQKLYRKRAGMALAHSAGAVAGTVMGAGMLGGMSIFFKPSTTAVATIAGAGSGAALGGAAVKAGALGGRVFKDAARQSMELYDGYGKYQLVNAAVHADAGSMYNQNAAGQATSFTPDGKTVSVPLSPVAPAGTTEPGKAVPDSGQAWAVAERDGAAALGEVLLPDGSPRSSKALQRLKQANMETEKYLAQIRQTKGITLSQAQESQKRIELQTEYLVEEALQQLSGQTGYAAGMEEYRMAGQWIREKVRAIVEKQNKGIF